MHTATYINNNCTIDLPPSSNWQMRLANQRPCTNTPPQTVDKVWAKHVAMLFENKGKVFWGHADWSMSSNSHSLVCFACLSGWSYLISLLVRGQLQFSNRNASHHLVSKSWGQTIHLLLFFLLLLSLPLGIVVAVRDTLLHQGNVHQNSTEDQQHCNGVGMPGNSHYKNAPQSPVHEAFQQPHGSYITATHWR